MHLVLLLLYRTLSYLLIPLILLHLFWKGLSNRAYWRRIGERFGAYAGPGPTGAIWVHAVSVGEVQAAAALVHELLRRYPHHPVLLTTTTPTGSDRVQALFGNRVQHCYAPLDLAHAVNRFFNWSRPCAAIILETELWPNLYRACGARKIPLVLASARVSPRSIGRYRMLVSLFKETLSHGIVIAAQTAADAERFISLGAAPARTHVTGNIKFDFELPKNVQQQGRVLRQQHAPDRLVWVAASTHTNEEEKVLAAQRQLQRQIPNVLLILVPRHPERFDSVANLLERQRFSYVRRSSEAACGPATEVLLGDTMGELMMFYAASDVAFVGGSLVRIGGHNLLEPASLQCPILTGPHTYNATDIAELLVQQGVAQVVSNEHELAGQLHRLLADAAERERMGQGAAELIRGNRGALKRLLALLEPLLQPPLRD